MHLPLSGCVGIHREKLLEEHDVGLRATAAAGASLALGAFLAGLVISESDYAHQALAELLPLRDVPISLFFVSVGMLVQVEHVLAHPLLVAGGLAVVIVGKTLAAAAGPALIGYSGRVSFLAGLTVSQVGEFAFVLVAFALGLGLLAAEEASLLVAAVALSMALAPLLMLLDDRLLQPRYGAAVAARAADAIDVRGAEVIIAGHGRFGMTVGRLLQANRCRTVVLDHDEVAFAGFGNERLHRGRCGCSGGRWRGLSRRGRRRGWRGWCGLCRGRRRLLGGLEYHGIARHQGGPEESRGHGQRFVPRGDDSHHAHRAGRGGWITS